jgi:prepilin signal peptidase PulO-like enzyme (type II secretory pathway)
MTEYITLFKDWVIALGEKHEVDPLLIGSLYLVSKICFFSFLGWALKTFRAKKPILIPLLFASLSFSLPYLYLIIAGRNISVWVYVFIGLMFIYGAFSIWKKITTDTNPA